MGHQAQEIQAVSSLANTTEFQNGGLLHPRHSVVTGDSAIEKLTVYHNRSNSSVSASVDRRRSTPISCIPVIRRRNNGRMPSTDNFCCSTPFITKRRTFARARPRQQNVDSIMVDCGSWTTYDDDNIMSPQYTSDAESEHVTYVYIYILLFFELIWYRILIITYR